MKFTCRRKSRATCYHTEKDCPRVSGEITKLTEQDVEWHDLDKCDFCSGENVAQGPDGPNEYKQYIGLGE